MGSHVSDKPNKSKTNDIIFIALLVIATLMIIYSFFIYYSSSHSEYYPVEGIIKEIDCNSFAINNHLNEYHCVVSIEYDAFSDYLNSRQIKKYNTSLIFVDNELFVEGNKVYILVNINNPLDIKIQTIPDEVFSAIISILAFLLIVVASTIRYVKIE